MKSIAVYPGSFDPITNGHLDIIRRALTIFDEIVVLIAVNVNKKTDFSLSERIEMVKKTTSSLRGVKVATTQGLTINYAKEIGAHAMVRGLRAATDFDFEFQLMSANRYIDQSVESVFLMAKHEFMFVSSSTIKEMHKGGVDVSSLVPLCIVEYLTKLSRQVG